MLAWVGCYLIARLAVKTGWEDGHQMRAEFRGLAAVWIWLLAMTTLTL